MDKPTPVDRQNELPVGSLLKAAIERQEAPPDLSGRIREQIEEATRRRRFFHQPWGLQLVAATALIAVWGATWCAIKRERLPALTDRPAQNAYIRQVSAVIPGVLRVGLGDHIHCSIFRKYSRNPPTLAEMGNKLGPAYVALLPVVQAAVPRDYRLVLAHKCGYAGRKFVHLTLTNGKDLLSVVVAQKQGEETLSNLRPAMGAAGLPVYQAETRQYQVAAFEAGSQIAFVVSEKRQAENLAIAAAMAPGVRRVLVEAQA